MKNIDAISKIHICHLTTVHRRDDIRIFVKECQSLVRKGYKVSLLVSDGRGEDEVDGVKIMDIGRFFNLQQDSSRILRMFKSLRLMLKAAIAQNADVYHFHDPELMIIGHQIKNRGFKVIYDIHEDIPKQVYNKPYIHSLFKPLISTGLEALETFFAKRYDALVVATPSIHKRFESLNSCTETVCNYPKALEFQDPPPWNQRENAVCYVGVITENRGIRNLVKALEYTDVQLHLAGLFYPDTLYDEIRSMPSWKQVTYYGVVERSKIREILFRCKIGMVTLHPITNYLDSLPVKMFEYMLSGLPVIASNFPLWDQIIQEESCGVTVDPLDPVSIADAINLILSDDSQAEKKGINGQLAVTRKYNWQHEEEKLINLYAQLTSGSKL